MGRELGNETFIEVLLVFVFSIVSTKFHIDRERRFLYELSVEKLVFVNFRGCLGQIESEKIKTLQFFRVVVGIFPAVKLPLWWAVPVIWRFTAIFW